MKDCKQYPASTTMTQESNKEDHPQPGAEIPIGGYKTPGPSGTINTMRTCAARRRVQSIPMFVPPVFFFQRIPFYNVGFSNRFHIYQIKKLHQSMIL